MSNNIQGKVVVITMHYGANPAGKGAPDQYIKTLGAARVKVSPLNPADAVVY